MNTIHISYKHPPLLPKNSVLCLGYFDALHLGHQEVIKKAKESNKNLFVLTFSMSPKQFLNGEKNKDLVSEDERINIFKSLGVNTLLILDCSSDLFNLTSFDFIKVLDSLKPSIIFCGHDYTFGKDKLGNISLLKKYFNVEVIEEVKFEGEKISTTRIKRCLENGNIIESNLMLGRKYSIIGKIVSGAKIGRKLGFKTINMNLNNKLVRPKNGVYQTHILYNGVSYQSISNIGTHPTINNIKTANLETHILGFDKEINGEKIKIYFDRFLRDEIKFNSADELIKQIKKDIKAIK